MARANAVHTLDVGLRMRKRWLHAGLLITMTPLYYSSVLFPFFAIVSTRVRGLVARPSTRLLGLNCRGSRSQRFTKEAAAQKPLNR